MAVGSSSRSPWGRRIAWVWMVAAGIGALVLLLLIVFPSLFGKDFNPDALVAFVLVAATLAYAILTYLLLSASERQVATLETQIEEERATRRSQEAQAALADEKSQALIEEERATRESREREAAEAREASKVLLDESRRARRDDHAPYVAVSITRSNRGTEQRKNDTWIEAEMPPHLMKDDFSDWRAWVFIEFTVHNDGPGSVVVDISPSFSPGELGWPVDDSTTGEERRTRTKLLPAGGQARIFWRMVAPAEFWWYRARKQVFPDAVPDSTSYFLTLEFPFMTHPSNHAVIDRHTLPVDLTPFTASEISLSWNGDRLWLNAWMVARSKREYPGLDYPIQG